jgi:hypothetical protein
LKNEAVGTKQWPSSVPASQKPNAFLGSMAKKGKSSPETMVFTMKYRGFRLKFSLKPIQWLDVNLEMKKNLEEIFAFYVEGWLAMIGHQYPS